MPDNSEIIERLVTAVNKKYDREREQLESYLEKLNRHIEKGSSPEVVRMLQSEVDRLTESINTQNDTANKFYNDMLRVAGGNGNLNEEMLKDMYKARHEYARLMTEHKSLMRDITLSSSFKTEKSAEIKRSIDELIKTFNDKYGRSEYERFGGARETEAEKRFRIFINQYKYNRNGVKNEYNKNLDEIKEADVEHIHAIARAERLELDRIRKIKAEEAERKKAEREEEAEREKAEKEEEKRVAERWNKFKDRWTKVKAYYTEVKGYVKETANLWLKYNAQAISDAKRLGMTSKEEAMGYMETLMENSKTLARNFGMTAEQAMKMQEAYTKVTGRASMLTQSQMEDIAAASKLMGEETVQNAIGIMDSMGSTSQTAIELMDKNFVRAANAGLDTVKASEAFVKNMSLANKLNFKNGVDGISRMTVLAQRMKMDLQEVASVADKFSTIEGAIEGSARLQVLGGTGSMYGSNPMQMMYEALSDPEALYKRMTRMFGEQAVFNRATGESELSPLQLQIIKEQAKAMGMNPEEAVKSAKQQGKLRAMEYDMRAYASGVYAAASDEDKAKIENRAEYDKELGTWVVKYLDDYGKEKVADIKTLTPDQLEGIKKDSYDDVKDIRLHVRKIAMGLIGTKERWDSMKDQLFTGLGQSIGGTMKRIDTALSFVNDSSFWKFLTGGSSIATAALLTGLVGRDIGKFYLGNAVKRFILGGSGNADNVTRAAEGVNLANETKTLDNVEKVQASGRTIGKFGKLGKISRLGLGTAILGGLATTGFQWHKASNELKRAEDALDKADAGTFTVNGVEYQRRNIGQERIAARNRATEGHAGAVGAGIGMTAGSLAGAAIGQALIPVPVVGALIGGAIGGWVGEKYGKKLGRSMASTEDSDTINAHLNEINKADEEENFRRIVLPVESIDYNVALIANRLNIASASPARGNVYLQAEAMGELNPVVQSQPIPTTNVNKVDSQVVYASQVYRPNGPLSLNVDGSINLKLDGNSIGKLMREEIVKLFRKPDVQKEITDMIVKCSIRNANAGRNYNENVDSILNTANRQYS